MSALGFGLFIGALAIIVTLTHRAYERPGGVNFLLLACGISAWIITPNLIEGFLGFIVGATIPPMVAALALHSKIDLRTQQKAIDDERRAAERAANQARREAARAAADSWPNEQTGWNPVFHPKD